MPTNGEAEGGGGFLALAAAHAIQTTPQEESPQLKKPRVQEAVKEEILSGPAQEQALTPYEQHLQAIGSMTESRTPAESGFDCQERLGRGATQP